MVVRNVERLQPTENDRVENFVIVISDDNPRVIYCRITAGSLVSRVVRVLRQQRKGIIA